MVLNLVPPLCVLYSSLSNVHVPLFSQMYLVPPLSQMYHIPPLPQVYHISPTPSLSQTYHVPPSLKCTMSPTLSQVYQLGLSQMYRVASLSKVPSPLSNVPCSSPTLTNMFRFLNLFPLLQFCNCLTHVSAVTLAWNKGVNLLLTFGELQQ